MKIGIMTQKRMQIYNLTAQEVYFAELLHSGATQIEAYCLTHPTSTQAPTTAAQNLIKANKGIQQLLNALALTQPTDNKQASKRPSKDKGQRTGQQQTEDEDRVNITTKDGQLRALQTIYDNTTENKQRQDILKQISDLQQLKHEQTGEEECRVHYFLPEDCDNCPYRPPKTTE